MTIPWSETKSNDVVVRIANYKKETIIKIRLTQFIGHIMRKKKLEHVLIT